MSGFTFSFFYNDALRQIPISEIDFSTRAMNAMGRNGIKTIGDILDKWDLLMHIRGIGQNTVNEIHAKMFAVNLERIWDDDKRMYKFAQSLREKKEGKNERVKG